MRLFISAAPLLAETHKSFEARTGKKILERYGMTETNMSTSNPYDETGLQERLAYPCLVWSYGIADAKTGESLA